MEPTVLIWTGFALGLLGSAHCVGMCGPIALSLPVREGSKAGFITGRLLYNAGRTVTYMLMGALVGVFGTGLSLAGYQQALSIVAGGTIVAIVLVPRSCFTRFLHAGGSGGFLRVFSAPFVRLMKLGTPGAMFGVGLLNGLLPCGFVYLGLIGALGMGSVGSSAAYMGLFGVGTMPVMVGVSLAPGYLGENVRKSMQRMLPYMALAVGLLLILRGLSLGISFISPELDPQAGLHAVVESCH